MGSEKDDPVLGNETADHAPHGVSSPRIELCRGLIEEKNIEVRRGGTSKRDPLSLAARQLSKLPMAGISERKGVQDLHGASFGRSALPSAKKQWEDHMIEGSASWGASGILEDPSDPADSLGVDGAGCGRPLAGQDRQQSALPRARWPHEPHQHAGLQGQRQVLEKRRLTSETMRQVVQPYEH